MRLHVSRIDRKVANSISKVQNLAEPAQSEFLSVERDHDTFERLKYSCQFLKAPPDRAVLEKTLIKQIIRMETRPPSIGGSANMAEFSLEHSGSLGYDRPDFVTPRDLDEMASPSIAFGPPASPASVRKSKPRASKILNRHDSLKESKILAVTGMRRTDSVMQPELFQYHNHFEFLGTIGATKISEVFRVRHRHSGELFAVKRSRQRFKTKLQRERALREIKAVAALPAHSNIVGQYRAWQEAGHFYIQMDYCEGGSLHQRIHGPRAAPLTDAEVWQVALDVASGLHFLHSNNVLHLDIKPENIYRNLDGDGTPGPWRIGDFGLAVARESKDWEEGDGDYVAPELLRTGIEPTPAADIFSLGATLYECATGQKLARREGSADAAEVVLPDRPPALQVLLTAMLLPDPTTRPLAAQVATFTLNAIQQSEAQRTPEAAPGTADQETFEFNAGSGPAASPEPLIGGGNGAPGAAFASGHPQRWAPSLSPLISEGALTPGAAAGLMGLTPPTGGSGAALLAAAAAAPPPAEAEEGPGPERPPPLRLPLHQVHHHPPSTSRGGGDSFRIRRRDVAPVNSELLGE